MTRIFVSSSWEDMRITYRPAVFQAIRKAGGTPVGMEDFGSTTERADERSVLAVGQADIYLLLIGFRYGSLAPDEHKSYTELEYDMAVQRGMTILCYLASDRPEEISRVRASFPPGTADVDGDSDAAGIARQLLQAFRSHVWNTHTCSTYASLSDLCVKVERDVNRELRGGFTEGEIRLMGGYNALTRGDYTAALLDLQLASLNLPEVSNPKGAARARFLRSLAQLGGRRPVALTLTAFKEVQSLLETAIGIHERYSYLLALAAMELDFGRNGMTQYTQSAQRHLARMNSIHMDAEDSENIRLLGLCQPSLMSDLGL